MFGQKDDEETIPRDEVERELRDHGTAAMAAVDQASVDRSRPTDPGSVRWQFTLKVQPASGRAFDATFAQELPADATFTRPAHVLYDPEHHSRVMIDPAHLGQDIRAQSTIAARGLISSARRASVPAHCPNCGAPVDQAVESMRADPWCHFCNQALPATEPPR
jgi:hypothetical protein